MAENQRLLGRQKGTAVSAERRASSSNEMIDAHIKPYWHLPSKTHPTKMLLRAAGGLSVNTVKKRLGSRRKAQILHEFKEFSE